MPYFLIWLTNLLYKKRFANKIAEYAECIAKNAVGQHRIKDALCFDISDEIVADMNVAFRVIAHGIAFADLDFLYQPHQRGTV